MHILFIFFNFSKTKSKQRKIQSPNQKYRREDDYDDDNDDDADDDDDNDDDYDDDDDDYGDGDDDDELALARQAWARPFCSSTTRRRSCRRTGRTLMTAQRISLRPQKQHTRRGNTSIFRPWHVSLMFASEGRAFAAEG